MSWQARFSQAKIQEMRNAFGLFDRDGDGTINAKVKKSNNNYCKLNLSCINFISFTGTWSSDEDNGQQSH